MRIQHFWRHILAHMALRVERRGHPRHHPRRERLESIEIGICSMMSAFTPYFPPHVESIVRVVVALVHGVHPFVAVEQVLDPLTSPEQRRCAPTARNGRESSPRAKGHRASSPRPRMPMPDGPPPSNPVQRRLRKRLMARWKVLEETFRTRHPPLPGCMLVRNADVTKSRGPPLIPTVNSVA